MQDASSAASMSGVACDAPRTEKPVAVIQVAAACVQAELSVPRTLMALVVPSGPGAADGCLSLLQIGPQDHRSAPDGYSGNSPGGHGSHVQPTTRSYQCKEYSGLAVCLAPSQRRRQHIPRCLP